MCFFFKLTTGLVLVSDWIASSCQVNLLFFTALVLCICNCSNSKQKAKQYSENLSAKFQKLFKILAYGGLA